MQVEGELREHCTRLLSLIDGHLLAADKMPLGRVFFLKLAGDFSRYLCEISVEDERHEHVRRREQSVRAACPAAT